MTTLAIMKARIANELGQRSDLDDEIANAINDAIGAYQQTRFHFNEGRTVTFTTVAGQEFYDADDAANIAKLWVVDYMVYYVGDTPYHLGQLTPAEMEGASANASNTGEPGAWCWYGDQIRIYPAPSGAYTVRVGGTMTIAAPATDAEANNPWMTHAERLIRSRAKLELAIHVLKEQDTAAAMGEAVREALQQLNDKTTKRTMVNQGRVRAMNF